MDILNRLLRASLVFANDRSLSDDNCRYDCTS